MKILVIGGTGLIGKAVCKKLTDAGNEVVVGAPSEGVNVITGVGLANALNGADVVIDLSNSKTPDAAAALAFFETAGKNLAAAEKLAGTKHHLILSIVGTDRAQHIGYLQAKKQQEDLIARSGIPYTIIRSTQFFEHTATIINVQGDDREVHVSTMDYQPIAAENVVNYVIRFAMEQPKNSIVDIAGPDRAPMNEFVAKFLAARRDNKIVVPNEDNKYMFFPMTRSGLVPEGEFYTGDIKFEDWLKKQQLP